MQQWKREREPYDWRVEEREKTGGLGQECPARSREARRRPPSGGPSRGPGTRRCVQHSDRKTAPNDREMRADAPGLDHPGRGEKEEVGELVRHTPQASHARARGARVWPQAPGKGCIRKKASSRRRRTKGTGRSGRMATQRSQGQRAHEPGSSETQHEEGAASRALRAQATRLERKTRDRARPSSTCRGGEINKAEGGRMGRGSGTPRRVRRRRRRRRWRRQAMDRRPNAQHTQGARAGMQRVRPEGHKLRRGMAARVGTRCGMLQNNVPHARAEVQLVVSSGRHASATGGERVRGAGIGGGAGRHGPYGGGPTHTTPLGDGLGVSRRDVVAPVSGESRDSAAKGSENKGAGAEGRDRGRGRGGRGQGRTRGDDLRCSGG